jgi:anti-sigma regulatory factor (Ser/Thr protein kinase)
MSSHSGDTGVSPRTPWMTRSLVRHLLAEWDAPGDLIDVAELLASELATNAVRFGSTRPARRSYVPCITLAVWHAPGLAVIEISDENEKPPELQATDEESEGGRGLQLIESLSLEWGYYHPRPGWKTVYAVIDQRSAHALPAACRDPSPERHLAWLRHGVRE